jgi:hypothetical protein
LTVSGADVSGGSSEDIGLALGTIAPGNATRRYSANVVHWRPPAQGLAPWLHPDDYERAERQPLGADATSILADLPTEVRPTLADLHVDLCRPVTATLERLGWLAGSHWTPEVGYAAHRTPNFVPVDDQCVPVRHDSAAALRGFLIVEADETRSPRVLPPITLAGFAEVRAYIGGTPPAGSGLHVARVFWGSDAEVRFDDRTTDPIGLSQTFADPRSGRPLLHGYKVETEGLRFRINGDVLSSCLASIEGDLQANEGLRRFHEAQFLRYLIESRGYALGIKANDLALGAEIITASVGEPTFSAQLRRMLRFWSAEGLERLFGDVRGQLLGQHPLMTPSRVASAAAALSSDNFHALLTECIALVRQPAAMSDYLRSVIVHSLMLRIKLLVSQVGQGDDRKLLAHSKLPIQFGAEAQLDITICEAGAAGDGTIRAVVDNWSRALELVASGYLGDCQNAEEDALLRQFWTLRERHEEWRNCDARDTAALSAIARELGVNDARPLLPALVRILFSIEHIEAEQFSVYDIASDIEAVRGRIAARLGRPATGWELASAAVVEARASAAPLLKRLHDAFAALDLSSEGSLTPDARLAEQVYRLAAPLCTDGCRGCVHQSSEIMSDSLMRSSVSRSLLERFLARVDP